MIFFLTVKSSERNLRQMTNPLKQWWGPLTASCSLELIMNTHGLYHVLDPFNETSTLALDMTFKGTLNDYPSTQTFVF